MLAGCIFVLTVEKKPSSAARVCERLDHRFQVRTGRRWCPPGWRQGSRRSSAQEPPCKAQGTDALPRTLWAQAPLLQLPDGGSRNHQLASQECDCFRKLKFAGDVGPILSTLPGTHRHRTKSLRAPVPSPSAARGKTTTRTK